MGCERPAGVIASVMTGPKRARGFADLAGGTGLFSARLRLDSVYYRRGGLSLSDEWQEGHLRGLAAQVASGVPPSRLSSHPPVKPARRNP